MDNLSPLFIEDGHKNQYGHLRHSRSVSVDHLRLSMLALPGRDVHRLRERKWEGPLPTGIEIGFAGDNP